MNVTPQMTGMPRAGGEHRTVEDVALRQLPPDEQLRFDAVEYALRTMKLFRSRDKRLAMVDMVYFRRTHTVFGAAVHLEVSSAATDRWNTEFLLAIYGFLDSRKK